MKNLTSIVVVLCICFSTMANDWPYNRLERLYKTDPSKCLRISLRYMKHLPENPVPFYFASLVYRDKSQTHLEMRTRYMLMSKSIGCAMKFEDLEDVDLELKVQWEKRIEELQIATESLVAEMAQTELANFGDRLAIKYEKMVDRREEILLVFNGTSGAETPVGTSSPTSNTGEVEVVIPATENAQEVGSFGLATGDENIASFNKIQERELLNLINEERKALFLQPLKWEEDLARAARYHASDMATQDYFFDESYDRVNGQLVEVADMKTRTGQFYLEKNIQSENIASGNLNAKEAFNQWMMYAKQYDVMYEESSKKVGIGLCYDASSVYGYYWVLVTAKR